MELRFETLMRARQEGMNNKVQVEEDEDAVAVVVAHLIEIGEEREKGNVFVMTNEVCLGQRREVLEVGSKTT